MPLKTTPPQSSQGFSTPWLVPSLCSEDPGQARPGDAQSSVLGLLRKEGFVQGLALYALCKSAVAGNQEIAPGDAVCA